MPSALDARPSGNDNKHQHRETMMHLWNKRTADAAWQWAQGPQLIYTPRPKARTFCGLDFWDTGHPAQTPEQHAQAPGMAICPTCAQRQAGHARVLSMIHAGAERARREANGQH